MDRARTPPVRLGLRTFWRNQINHSRQFQLRVGGFKVITELKEKSITCPFCWELIDILIDPTESQTYTEDCSVCCHPILIRCEVYRDSLDVTVTQEDLGF